MTELQDLRLFFTVPRPEIQPVQTAGSEAGPGVSEQDVIIPYRRCSAPHPNPHCSKSVVWEVSWITGMGYRWSWSCL